MNDTTFNGYYLPGNIQEILSDNKIDIQWEEVNFKTLDVTSFDTRNGHTYRIGNDIIYYRKLLFVKFILKIEVLGEKKFRIKYNKLFKYLPFEMGGLTCLGKTISDFICLNLLLSDIFVLRGLAFEYNNQINIVFGPSTNGKTTLFFDLIKIGAKMISEDNLIVNFSNDYIYPCEIRTQKRNFNREINRKLSKQIEYKDVIRHKVQITDKKLMYLTTNNYDTSFELIDYASISLFFMENRIIQSYIFHKKLTKSIFEKITKLNKINIPTVSYNNYKSNEFVKKIIKK